MSISVFPCCPLCDQPIDVYDEHTIYVQDDHKALAHLECVVDLDDPDEFEDDGIEYVQFPDDAEEDEEDEWD
jgi:hypothetical protein